MSHRLNDSQRHFAEGVLRKRRIFLPVMALGILVGAAVVIHAVWLGQTHPDSLTGLRTILGIMILLNARQQLRQHRYAGILAVLLADPVQNQSSPSDAIAS